jgi:hypothetical protein
MTKPLSQSEWDAIERRRDLTMPSRIRQISGPASYGKQPDANANPKVTGTPLSKEEREAYDYALLHRGLDNQIRRG